MEAKNNALQSQAPVLTGDPRLSSVPTQSLSGSSLCLCFSNCQIQGFVFYLDNDKNTLNINTCF